jgi:putative hydrolase of the HAD superfamily
VLGRRIRSTYRELHDALRPYSSVEFDAFARELQEIDHSLWATRVNAGLEFPTIERFTRLVRRLGITDSDAAYRLTDVHMAAFRSLVRCVPHHEVVLERLRRRVRLAVCSNFSHASTAREVLRETHLLRHLDAVVISEEVGFRKPRSEIFQLALARLGADAGEVLHVGNELAVDVEGAARAGMKAVWITRRTRDPRLELMRYRGPQPAHVIRDVAELENLLDRLSRRVPTVTETEIPMSSLRSGGSRSPTNDRGALGTLYQARERQ